MNEKLEAFLLLIVITGFAYILFLAFRKEAKRTILPIVTVASMFIGGLISDHFQCPDQYLIPDCHNPLLTFLGVLIGGALSMLLFIFLKAIRKA